jgi:hypothetical protein
MDTAPKPKRKSLTKALQRQVFCEAGSKCPWCDVPLTPAIAEIHHIDFDRTNNSIENLILVCRNHHGEIGKQVIPHWEVMLKKQMLCNPGVLERLGLTAKPKAEQKGSRPLRKAKPKKSPIVNGDNHGIAGLHVNIETATFKTSNGKGRRENTPGLIESDPDMRTYATDLVARYIEYRLNGQKIEDSRRNPRRARPRPFSPGAAHTILGTKFGSQKSVLLISQSRFQEWVRETQKKIDGTTLGKINRSKRYPNYHTWEEHLRRRHGN